MKYVNIKGIGLVIFSDNNTHADIARKLGEVESAGFISITADDPACLQVDCYGRSLSTGKGIGPGDDKELMKMIHGY